MKVLMVCLGNICRSPLAEGILREKVNKYGLDWEIDSAGTSSWHIGEKPDARSVDIAGKYGLDITDQRARQFIKGDFHDFDLILTMDANNYKDVVRLAATEEDKKKVKMIMNFVNSGKNEAVPDPYWNDDGFDQVYKMLDRACEAIIEEYSEKTETGK